MTIRNQLELMEYTRLPKRLFHYMLRNLKTRENMIPQIHTLSTSPNSLILGEVGRRFATIQFRICYATVLLKPIRIKHL
jgi:hypothetical protein